MKFIHAADLHLDSPLKRLERYAGAPFEALRGATRHALENLIGLALAEEVAFVLIAGDLFDGEWRDYDYNAVLYFSRQMGRLNEAGIPVFLVRGNHDATTGSLARTMRLPANVTDFATDAPQTVCLGEHGVALHGQGYASPSVPHDLARDYPAARPGMLNIGLLHTSLTGRPNHETYAPCSVETLLGKGYAYWALGHAHTYERVREEPWIVFPGCAQGRNIIETGPKGCALVTCRDGAVDKVEFRALDVCRWLVCTVEVSGARTEDDVVETVLKHLRVEEEAADGRLLAARLRLIGACTAHGRLIGNHEVRAHLRSEVNYEFNGRVWLEKIEVHTTGAYDLEQLAESATPVGSLLQMIAQWQEDEAVLADLLEGFAPLRSRLAALRQCDWSGPDLDDPATLRASLEEVKHLLVQRLLDEEEAS
jgi:DNA repair protein SbcD/Mre11